MSDTNSTQLTLIGRLADSLINRRTGLFVAELILVIAGVLIALAVDEWISDSRDRKTEMVYLDLLAQDIDGIRNQADLQIEFEQEKIDIAAAAYAALSSPDLRARQEEIGSLLPRLISRRTLNLNSATYDQMVSSGQLQLISNHELRNRIVRFFAIMERNERIAENNNRDLIDNVYVPFVLGSGISALQGREALVVTDQLNRANAIVYKHLGPGFLPPEDRILLAPADADSWNDIRRHVLFRMRIAATGKAMAESTLEQINDIASAVAAELDSR